MTDVEIAFAKEALNRLSVLVEEDKNKPNNPKVMKLISHVDARAIHDFYDCAEKRTLDVVKLFNDAVGGLMAVQAKCLAGGKRDEIVKLIEESLNKVGIAKE